MTDTTTAFGLLRLPDEIVFGVGAVASLPRIVSSLGTRALVVCDPFLEPTPAFIAALAGLERAGVAVTVESGIVPELPIAVVEAAAVRASAVAPDVIVGIGGGSALDMAKLISLCLSHGPRLRDYYGENNIPGPIVPVVAVPTTAGTGSEVTPVAVLADPDRELKVGISSPFLIPRAAVVDPRLTIGAPAAVTASAGADALVHAIEAYTSSERPPLWDGVQPVFVGRNILSSSLALQAITLLGGSIRRAVADGDDLDARVAMAHGSLLAGMAFGSAGTHLSHAIQYPVGALTHTAHGVGTGMLLPYVLQSVLPTAVDRLADVAGALGVARQSSSESAQAAVDEVSSIMADIGLPITLSSMGVADDDVPRIVELALSVRRLVTGSTLEATPESLTRIVRAALTGDRASLASATASTT